MSIPIPEALRAQFGRGRNQYAGTALLDQEACYFNSFGMELRCCAGHGRKVAVRLKSPV
jgi:hypothetical protein